MSAPSTTTYFPFDSDALGVFSATQTDNFLTAAFLMLLLYDHIITLDMEVEWIWTLRWRLPKILFIINRYIITVLLLLDCLPELIYPVFVSFCNFHLVLWVCVPILNFGAAELLVILRVSSLYGHSKLIIWPLSIFFFLAIVGAIVSQVLFGRAIQTILYYQFLPGCWEWSPGLPNQWAVWITFLSVEGVTMLLTAYKAISYGSLKANRAVTVLARDSIVYFIIIFACLASILASDVGASIKISVQIPAQCAASIAVGRMMMNIRGLMLGDPEHTVHLETLQFTSVVPRAELSTVDEEVV